MVPEPQRSGLIHHTETRHEASGNNPNGLHASKPRNSPLIAAYHNL